MENPTEHPSPSHPRDRYWRRVQHLTASLLLVWFLVTFAMIFFARELSNFTFFGWTFSFYMAAQGTTLVYVAIIGAYAWRMQGLDQILKDESRDGR